MERSVRTTGNEGRGKERSQQAVGCRSVDFKLLLVLCTTQLRCHAYPRLLLEIAP